MCNLMMRRILTLALVALITSGASLFPSVAWAASARNAKNVILMIADGAGFNAFIAASYYQHGELGRQVYDEFPVRFACTTYSLNQDGTPQGYDTDKTWSDFNYVREAPTDSAAAATALHSGVKTTNGRINTTIDGKWLTTIAETADATGRSTGVVSSVQISHATPACVWAHNDSRGNYEEIANEMIYESGLDVILGAGHPEYNSNGQPGAMSYKYVGGVDTWNALKYDPAGPPESWTFIEEKAGFEAIANEPWLAPDRLIGITQVHNTLQYNRSGSEMGNLNTDVPTLATMTKAALNVLSKNESGFFLMVEGGAVDWANHGNNIGRMIEEQIDFNNSVEAIVEWVEKNSSWDETLLIVAADHETGMLWGPDSFTDVNGNGVFDEGVDIFNDWYPVVNEGQGNLPGVQYASHGHTNALVPLYATGPGTRFFRQLWDGKDRIAHMFWGVKHKYVDNTDIYRVMNRVLKHRRWR